MHGFARRLWTPGTVIEEVLGYDLAAGQPATDTIWRLLEVPRPPGVRLLPRHWQPGQQPPLVRLPPAPVSLILQFKRPEYLASNAAKQYRLWRNPYFRFTRDPRQHRVLRRLEQRAGDEVVVRYASPAFHKNTELELARLSGQVCTRSGFVSPDQLGGHAVWTYQTAGNVGLPNPSGLGSRFETIEDVLEGLARTRLRPDIPGIAQRSEVARAPGRPDASDGQDLEPYPGPSDGRAPFADHVQALSAALTYRSPSLREPLQAWRRAIETAELEISPRTLDIVINIATVQTAMTALAATWFIYGG